MAGFTLRFYISETVDYFEQDGVLRSLFILVGKNLFGSILKKRFPESSGSPSSCVPFDPNIHGLARTKSKE